MIATLADTSGWYSIAVPSEATHEVTIRWFQENQSPILTTDYIIDETLTLLRSRGHRQAAINLGRWFFESGLVIVHYLEKEEILLAWESFSRYSDKGWSFTDCTSKVVMDRLGITTALAFDHHFRQFGNIQVVP